MTVRESQNCHAASQLSHSPTARFQLRNVRYYYRADGVTVPLGDDFDSAFQLEGIVGSSQQEIWHPSQRATGNCDSWELQYIPQAGLSPADGKPHEQRGQSDGSYEAV